MTINYDTYWRKYTTSTTASSIYATEDFLDVAHQSGAEISRGKRLAIERYVQEKQVALEKERKEWGEYDRYDQEEA